MAETSLPIPPLLLALVERGVWPFDDEESRRFELAYPNRYCSDEERTRLLEEYGPPRVPVDRIRRIHPTQERLCLYPPPFLPSRHRTSIYWGIRDHLGFKRFFAPDEVDRDQMIEIADFGHGADTPIILDYQTNVEQPTVRRLDPKLVRLSSDGEQKYGEQMYWDSHWIEIAASFDEFARLLGLA